MAPGGGLLGGAGGDGRQRVQVALLGRNGAFMSGDGEVASPRGFEVCAFQRGQSADVVLQLDLAQIARVTSGQRFGLGGRGADIAATEVLDLDVDDLIAPHLFDEQRLGLM